MLWAFSGRARGVQPVIWELDRRLTPEHLRWPDLDVDLAVDSIEQPERYPLKSKL